MRVNQPPQGGYPQQPQGYPGQQPPPSPPGGFPQGGGYPPPPGGVTQPPWAGGDSQPPWAGSDLPPLPSNSSDNWIRQGPEAFESDGGGKGPKIAGIIVAVVVVIGLAVGAFFLFGNSSNEPEASGGTTQGDGDNSGGGGNDATEEPEPPRDPMLPADIGGAQELDKAQITDYAGIQGIRTLTEGEDEAFTTGGATDARALVSNFEEDGTQVVMFVVQMPDEEAAAQTRDQLGTLQENYGLEIRDGETPGINEAWNVAEDGDESMVRAHYVSEDLLVRIQVRGVSESTVVERYEAVLEDQVVAQVPNE
ncbi:hypothetical protein [Actinoalloteichus hymeniacidonis]|uniref:hypothetical protein n=1 Tax=Actinoalloteichus hymeniacidonis TaxID=340345 RepID=UPI0012FC6993|nr:hypothetical protein [Actinoalloteichus hymeniacidonis]MBB5911087.1 hypothetical protein [Actinoalloteichus hymeniacidonis]